MDVDPMPEVVDTAGGLPGWGPALVLGQRMATDLPEHGVRRSSTALCPGVFCRPREGLQHGLGVLSRVPGAALPRPTWRW